MRSILGYERNGAIALMFTNTCDRKRACLVGSERTAVSTDSSTRFLLILLREGAIRPVDKIQHHGISSSIHYIYFSSSMESQGVGREIKGQTGETTPSHTERSATELPSRFVEESTAPTQGQFPMVSARSSADVAAANPSHPLSSAC